MPILSRSRAQPTLRRRRTHGRVSGRTMSSLMSRRAGSRRFTAAQARARPIMTSAAVSWSAAAGCPRGRHGGRDEHPGEAAPPRGMAGRRVQPRLDDVLDRVPSRAGRGLGVQHRPPSGHALRWIGWLVTGQYPGQAGSGDRCREFQEQRRAGPPPPLPCPRRQVFQAARRAPGQRRPPPSAWCPDAARDTAVFTTSPMTWRLPLAARCLSRVSAISGRAWPSGSHTCAIVSFRVCAVPGERDQSYSARRTRPPARGCRQVRDKAMNARSASSGFPTVRRRR